MLGTTQLNNLAWALTVMMEIAVCLYLAHSGRFRVYPAFFVYLTATILQSGLILTAYQHWGFRDEVTWEVVWGSQAFILLARWIAVAEIAERLLSGYAGIWVLARGVLIAVGMAVLGYGMSFAHGDWHQVVLSAERGLELSVAAVNYSIFEPRLQSHVNLWNFLRIVTYLASLVIWFRAVRYNEATAETRSAPVVSAELYEDLSSGIDTRLQHLNAQLNQIINGERTRR